MLVKQLPAALQISSVVHPNTAEYLPAKLNLLASCSLLFNYLLKEAIAGFEMLRYW